MENTGERKTGGTGGNGGSREAETDVRESDSALISAILLEGESENEIFEFDPFSGYHLKKLKKE